MKNLRYDGAGRAMAEFDDGSNRYLTDDELKTVKKADIKSHEKYKAEKLDAANAIAEARKVLADTHDEVVRAFDTGQPVPDDINAARVAAWSVIDAAKKSTA